MDKKTKYIVNELIEHIYNLRKDLFDLNLSYNRLQERVLKIENPELAEELKPSTRLTDENNAKIADKYMVELLELQRQTNADH